VQVSDAPLSMYHRGSGLVDGLVALRMLRPLLCTKVRGGRRVQFGSASKLEVGVGGGRAAGLVVAAVGGCLVVPGACY